MEIYNGITTIHNNVCQQNLYTPNINLTKFEPVKPYRSGDITLLVFKISKEAVKQSDCFHFEAESFLPQRYVTIFFDPVPVAILREMKNFVQKTNL